MIAALLDGLLQANLAAAAAILLVMMLRKPLRRAFGARVAYALWIAVPAAVAATFLPQPAIPAAIQPIVLAATGAVDLVAPGLASDRAGLVLLGLWLAGGIAAAGLLAYRQRRFMAALGRLEATGAPDVFRAEHAGVGPAVVGAWRPRIVAPADFEARFAADERAVILAHEDVHLRTGDARINALAAAAQCAAWFNPLVHLGARTLRIDQELACDAAVLARFPAARRLYGEVLLKTQLAAQPLPLGCHWPASASHPLKERIVMLKSPLPAPARRAAGLALVAMLSLGGAGLAWAAQADATVREQYDALKASGVESDILCKPDAAGQMKDCQLVRPTWLKKPDIADLVKYYPPTAAEHGVGAFVTIECNVAPTGYLQGCKVLREDLQGEAAAITAAAVRKGAFGDAALELSKIFQARMERAPGEPPMPTTGVRIPIRFLPIPLPHAPAQPA